jgi:glycosyl transferase family 87
VAERRAFFGDAVLYAASAAFALLTALTTHIGVQREWGWMAAGPYAAAAVLAFAVRGRGTRARAWLAAALFVSVALIPLAVEVGWRASTRPGLHVQSEVLLTEEGARALLRGQDPYVAPFAHGPLGPWPEQTREHLAYPPGILLFGLPRAVTGRSPLTDARVWFAVATIALSVAALRGWRGPADRKIRAMQFLLVLPTGALIMPTNGKGLTILAALLLALVLLRRERWTAAGAALGLGALLNQLVWPVLPFVLARPGDADARGSRPRAMGTPLALMVVAMAPFVVWNPRAFVEDVVLFPLGVGAPQARFPTPTPGVLLARALPSLRGALAASTLVVVVALATWLFLRAPRPHAADVAAQAGLVLLVAMLIAPSARLGDFVFPVDLLVWARLLRPRPQRGDEPVAAPPLDPSGRAPR